MKPTTGYVEERRGRRNRVVSRARLCAAAATVAAMAGVGIAAAVTPATAATQSPADVRTVATDNYQSAAVAEARAAAAAMEQRRIQELIVQGIPHYDAAAQV